MDSEEEFTLPDLVVSPALTKKTNTRPKTKRKKNHSSDDEIEFDFGAHERRTNSSHEDSDVSSSSPRGKIFSTQVFHRTYCLVFRAKTTDLSLNVS